MTPETDERERGGQRAGRADGHARLAPAELWGGGGWAAVREKGKENTRHDGERRAAGGSENTALSEIVRTICVCCRPESPPTVSRLSFRSTHACARAIEYRLGRFRTVF